MMDVSKEMAVALSTAERVARLVQVIKVYRRDLLAAKETEAAMYAHGGLLSLEHIRDPAENPLLIGICFASLRSLLVTSSERALERDESE